MKRLAGLLPIPLFLLFMWLVLNMTLSAGNIVFGLLLAAALAAAASTLRPLRACVRHPAAIVKLVVHVVADILRSNAAVARLIWLGKRSGATPGFLEIPLDIRDPHGLAALACIVTYTPGTVWASFSDETRTLTLHVLDLKDEAQWTHTIKHRYERPLMEIFE